MWRVLVLTIFGAFAETIFCVEDNFHPLPFPFWASSLFPTTTSCIYTKRATCCLLPRSTNSVHWLLFFFFLPILFRTGAVEQTPYPRPTPPTTY